MTSILPVILCGGSGTRLWPLSRAAYPKQFLPLIKGLSLFQKTIERVNDAAFQAPLIICNEAHRFLVLEQMQEINVSPSALILEPVGRNTAPAAIMAALYAHHISPDLLMMIMPADHCIGDTAAFHAVTRLAATVAENGVLVTFGIDPGHPETGYGYIQQGKPATVQGAFHVAAFAEKPNLEIATQYLKSGDYLWNSGMFLFRAQNFLNEAENTCPAIHAHCGRMAQSIEWQENIILLDKEDFAACPADSIDYAIMEKTTKTCVVPCDLGWSDVGSWSAITEIKEQDADGNVLEGDTIIQNARGCCILSDNMLVAANHVENLVIIATDDAILISDKDHAQDVKNISERLQQEGRTEYALPPKVRRPWGWYQSIGTGTTHQVKHLCVYPGASISLQLHHHRSEHWIVVQGEARITRGADVLDLGVNESVHIPVETVHRLENLGAIAVLIVEVQCGDYLGEDDIVRLEDNYGRV